MENQITILNPHNAYLKQFQIAQVNLAMVIEEERRRKRISNSRKKTRIND
jgi:hypothetical protein